MWCYEPHTSRERLDVELYSCWLILWLGRKSIHFYPLRLASHFYTPNSIACCNLNILCMLDFVVRFTFVIRFGLFYLFDFLFGSSIFLIRFREFFTCFVSWIYFIWFINCFTGNFQISFEALITTLVQVQGFKWMKLKVQELKTSHSMKRRRSWTFVILKCTREIANIFFIMCKW